MTANRIKQLRETRRLSQEELGALVGTNKFKISRIETGETRLDLELAVKIAEALDVTLSEVLNLEATTVPTEDAEPYIPEPNDPLFRLVDGQKGRALYRVTSAALDDLGIEANDLILVEEVGAQFKPKPLAIVLVKLSDGKDVLVRHLLRQFVPPALLVTNSQRENRPPINMGLAETVVTAVVISRHHKLLS